MSLRYVILLILISAFALLLVINLINVQYESVNFATLKDSVNSAVYSVVNESEQSSSSTKTVYEKVAEITECFDKKLTSTVSYHGNYIVLYNYVVADRQYGCAETVTYTTQGDLTFLENVTPLVERWRAPISVSIYAPGTDFRRTLDSIAYLRNCESPLISEFVSFHLFFETGHIPKIFNTPLHENQKIYLDEYNCDLSPPYQVHREDLYKSKKNLTYPINVARNTARIAAQTHFILPSDIELYPTPNFPEKFLDMIARSGDLLLKNKKQVFVLPVFEVVEGSIVPESKTELQEMIKQKKAFVFHQRLCRECHMVPGYDAWIKTPGSDLIDVFISAKRTGKYMSWEPFYVGTNEEPFFDERFTWEGQSNKMSQNYVLCVLDYNYLVLDNAFLVHKPGIKRRKEQLKSYMDQVKETNSMRRFVREEIRLIYGSRKGCGL